jgi:histidyl-tRNA synthetase
VSDEALAKAVPVIEALRAGGVEVLMHSGGGSFKNQFKKADASGARYALIFGADELAQGMVTVKSLRDGSGAQVQRPLAQALDWAQALKA